MLQWFCKHFLPWVSVHQYTNEELSEKGDEMALVMLINKIQNTGDWKKFTEETDAEKEWADAAEAELAELRIKIARLETEK